MRYFLPLDVRLLPQAAASHIPGKGLQRRQVGAWPRKRICGAHLRLCCGQYACGLGALLLCHFWSRNCVSWVVRPCLFLQSLSVVSCRSFALGLEHVQQRVHVPIPCVVSESMLCGSRCLLCGPGATKPCQGVQSHDDKFSSSVILWAIYSYVEETIRQQEAARPRRRHIPDRRATAIRSSYMHAPPRTKWRNAKRSLTN